MGKASKMPVGKDITSIKEQGRNVPGKWVVKKMAVLCIMAVWRAG